MKSLQQTGKQMRIWTLTPIFFLMGGCLSNFHPSAKTFYEPPTNGTDTATVRLDMSYDNGFTLGTARIQEYRFVNGKSYCEEPALMDGSSDESKDGIRVEAGKLLTISSQAIAYSRASSSNQISINQNSCVNLFSFTPKSGGTYNISQKSIDAFGCSIEVTDNSTNEAPFDLRVFSQEEMEKITEDCSKK